MVDKMTVQITIITMLLSNFRPSMMVRFSRAVSFEWVKCALPQGTGGAMSQCQSPATPFSFWGTWLSWGLCAAGLWWAFRGCSVVPPASFYTLTLIRLLRGHLPMSGGNIRMSSHWSNFYELFPTWRKKLRSHLWLLCRWLPPTDRVQGWRWRFCPTFHWSGVIFLHLFAHANSELLQALPIISLPFKINLNFRYIKNLPLN